MPVAAKAAGIAALLTESTQGERAEAKFEQNARSFFEFSEENFLKKARSMNLMKRTSLFMYLCVDVDEKASRIWEGFGEIL